MQKFNPTKEQQKVIDLRDCNVLVSAAAGSGKTKVLVERIMKKVLAKEKPVDIDRLLIVTFTEAAAGEMRERISQAIEEYRLLEPENAHLERQASLVHNAQITTIHSFCLGVIRNYFNEIDLDPGFRLGEEAELLLLKGEVMEEVLEGYYEEKSPEFLSFVESYAAGKGDKSLEKLIYRLYDFSMSYPWPGLWIEKQKSVFCVETLEDFHKASWLQELIQFLKAEIADCLEENKAALELSKSPGPYMYEEALMDDREQLSELFEAESYTEIGRLLSAFHWTKLSAKRDASVDSEKREMVKLMRDSIKKTVKGLGERYYFQPEEEMLEDLRRVAPKINVLISLTLDFMEGYQKKKTEKNLLDFNDLEHYALKILVEEPKEGETEIVPTSTAVELSKYYDEILIDEYQDSNLVQETLLNSISQEKFGRPNVFMVGDVKQSIYKFRLARPEMFMEKLDSYQSEGSYVRVDLKKNFRSRKSVLEAVNHIFYGIMKRDLGNVDYNEDAALYHGREEKENSAGQVTEMDRCEILIAKASEEVSDKELEGRILAGKMKELHEKQNIPYKDMVILLRSMKGWSEELAAVLKEQGVPARAATQTGYFSAIEVMTVLNLLLVIDNPRQDIPLAAVLRSYIGGFSDEELAGLRSCKTEGELYDCLLEAEMLGETGENEEGWKQKTLRFLELLGELRALVPVMGIYELLTVIYEKTGYYNYVRALPGGTARCANLDMLLEKGASFECSSYGGLFQFNRYIEQLHQYEVDFGEAEVLLNNQDTAVIMSIHKSKGLEFPVVFIAGAGKSFNKQDTRERILIHSDLGIGPDYIDSGLRTKIPTLPKQVMKRRIDLENMGEELRVLYVAMTRAREKLIFTGCVRDIEKAGAKWEQTKPLLFSQRAGAGNFLDLIMPRVLAWQEEPKEGVFFEVKYMTEEELIVEEVYGKIGQEDRREQLLALEQAQIWDNEEKNRAEACLTYQYPYKEMEKLKSKLTVSEIKRLSWQEEEPGQMLWKQEERGAYIPGFSQETEKIKGVQRGVIYHRIMEHISFPRAAKEGLSAELKRLQKEERVTKEELSFVNYRKLTVFLNSDLGRRIKEAEEKQCLYREQPFVIGVPADRIQPEIKSKELVLVQGVMDCFFEEAGELVLVDYKTDRAENGASLLEKYKTQLDYYRAALEQLTGKLVKECCLYSFHLGEVIKC